MNSNTLNLILDLFKEYPNIHSCHISSSVVQDKESREICVISLNKINGSPLNLTSSHYISILNKSNRNFDQLLFEYDLKLPELNQLREKLHNLVKDLDAVNEPQINYKYITSEKI